MKKLFTILCAAALFASCGSSTDQKETTTDSVNSTAPEDAHHDHHGTEAEDGALTLNNGQKWAADQATFNHVAGLQKVAAKFKENADHSVEAYTSAGNEFADTLQVLVNDCRMSGPDHETLHKWLEPFMGLVKELQATTTVDAGEATMQSIDERLNIFGEYFATQQ